MLERHATPIYTHIYIYTTDTHIVYIYILIHMIGRKTYIHNAMRFQSLGPDVQQRVRSAAGQCPEVNPAPSNHKGLL